MRRYPTMVAVAAASALLFTACGGEAGESPADGEVLVYGAPLAGSSSSGHLDPALSTSVCDTGITFPIYDTLVHRDPKSGTPTPGLAESWTVTSPTTVELTLREGIRFHDGTPFDAAAVKTGLEHNATGAGQLKTSLGAILQSIDVVDPRTVRITLKGAVAGSVPVILSGREGMIIAPGSAATADKQPVGAGPFSFVSAVPGQSIELKKNPDYWDAARVKLGGVRFVHSDQGPPTINALIAGEIDMAEIFTDGVAAVKTQPELAIASQQGQTYQKINYNLTTPPFNDVRFRQAINYAIDRQAIRDAAFDGQGTIAWGPYPSTFAGYAPETENRYPHDPDRARALLAEAGLTNTHITAFNNGSGQSRRFGEIVKAQLAEVGITLDFQQSADIVQDYFTDKKQSSVLIIWPPRPDPADTLRIQFTPGSFNNAGGYDNPVLNDLVTRIRASASQDERAALMREASRLVVDQALDVPVLFTPLLKAHSTEVGGEIRQFEQCQMVDFSYLTKGS